MAGSEGRLLTPPSKGLAAGAGGVAVTAAAWIAAQRYDRHAIRSDPKRQALFAPLGGERRTVRSADGTEIAVRTFGPEGAPTIVLVHGWTCASPFWKLQVGALTGERRIVAYDLRGHGHSERAASGDYSLDAFASDLDAVLSDCVPAGERALLVGHSLGAMTIVEWAGRVGPEQVDTRASAIVLVNTGVGDLISRSLVVEGIPDSLARLQRLAGEGVLRARAPIPAFSTPISYRVIQHAVVGPDASPAEVAFCERLVLACPADVRSACGGTLSKVDLEHALRSLVAPTVVIAGERDRLTPPDHAHEMAESIPNVLDVVEVSGSGHMTPIEFPAATNALIAELAGARTSLRAAA